MGILRDRVNPILGLTIGSIWLSRVITFLTFPTPVTAPDSSTYYTGHFLDFSLVSLTGQAARGWPIPLIYAFMPNPEFLELFQLLFSAIAWSILLYSLYNSEFVGKRFNKYVLFLVTILGTSAQIVQHDTTVLSTSITNSLLVTLFAFVFSLRKIKSEISLFLVVFVSILLSIQKTTFTPVSFFIIGLSLYFCRRQVSKRITALLVFISLIAGLFSMLVGANVNNNWQISYSGQTLLWQLGGQSPAATEFAKFLRTAGAPNCITADAPYANLDTSIGKILNRCPESRSYLMKSIQKDFLKFTITHPKATAKLGVFGLGAALTDSASNYGNAVTIFPRALSGLFFGETSPSLVKGNIDNQVDGFNIVTSGAAFWMYSPLIFWIFLGLCGGFVSPEKRGHSKLLITLMLGCLVQSLFVVILLPSEWVRQTSPFMTGALIASAILSVKLFETIFLKAANSDKELAE